MILPVWLTQRLENEGFSVEKLMNASGSEIGDLLSDRKDQTLFEYLQILAQERSLPALQQQELERLLEGYIAGHPGLGFEAVLTSQSRENPLYKAASEVIADQSLASYYDTVTPYQKFVFQGDDKPDAVVNAYLFNFSRENIKPPIPQTQGLNLNHWHLRLDEQNGRRVVLWPHASQHWDDPVSGEELCQLHAYFDYNGRMVYGDVKYNGRRTRFMEGTYPDLDEQLVSARNLLMLLTQKKLEKYNSINNKILTLQKKLEKLSEKILTSEIGDTETLSQYEALAQQLFDEITLLQKYSSTQDKRGNRVAEILQSLKERVTQPTVGAEPLDIESETSSLRFAKLSPEDRIREKLVTGEKFLFSLKKWDEFLTNFRKWIAVTPKSRESQTVANLIKGSELQRKVLLFLASYGTYLDIKDFVAQNREAISQAKSYYKPGRASEIFRVAIKNADLSTIRSLVQSSLSEEMGAFDYHSIFALIGSSQELPEAVQQKMVEILTYLHQENPPGYSDAFSTIKSFLLYTPHGKRLHNYFTQSLCAGNFLVAAQIEKMFESKTRQYLNGWNFSPLHYLCIMLAGLPGLNKRMISAVKFLIASGYTDYVIPEQSKIQTFPCMGLENEKIKISTLDSRALASTEPSEKLSDRMINYDRSAFVVLAHAISCLRAVHPGQADLFKAMLPAVNNQSLIFGIFVLAVQGPVFIAPPFFTPVDCQPPNDDGVILFFKNPADGLNRKNFIFEKMKALGLVEVPDGSIREESITSEHKEGDLSQDEPRTFFSKLMMISRDSSGSDFPSIMEVLVEEFNKRIRVQSGVARESLIMKLINLFSFDIETDVGNEDSRGRNIARCQAKLFLCAYLRQTEYTVLEMMRGYNQLASLYFFGTPNYSDNPSLPQENKSFELFKEEHVKMSLLYGMAKKVNLLSEAANREYYENFKRFADTLRIVSELDLGGPSRVAIASGGARATSTLEGSSAPAMSANIRHRRRNHT